MNGNYIEVYSILRKINKLDARTYSNLLTMYGEELVNQIIEELIDENSANVFKFEYYISKIIAYDDVAAVSIFDAYGLELNNIPCLTREQNLELASEIYSIVMKLEMLIVELGYYEKIDSSYRRAWLSDKIEFCFKECNDKNKLGELRKLYNLFLRKRNILVEGNLRLVIAVAKNYYTNESIFNEAIQCGNLGLIRAVEKFDPSFNTVFTTYAYYWIRQSINRNISNILYPVVVSTHAVSSYYEMKNAVRLLEYELNREPTNLEIATYMGVTEDKIYLLKQDFTSPLPLDASIKEVENDRELTVIDSLEDRNASVEQTFFNNSLRDELRDVMNKFLNERERFTLEYRYGLIDGNKHTLEEVGREMGVSREWIRQIEKKAIHKLSRKCKDLIVYLR